MTTPAPHALDALDELPEAPAPDRAADRPFTAASPTLGLLADVEIEVTVELGRRRMPIGEVARLDVGSVLVLDTLAGEPLVVYANGRRIATGEAVVVDGQFGVRIQQLVGAVA
jgi:flagellar motor switch protein FliN/FliY